VTLTLGALLALAASPAFADVPRLINFQGRLADQSGTPLSGYFAMTFRIFDTTAGGSSCFSETQASVRVNGGLFSTAVGSGTPDGGIGFGCDFSKPYYLELMVGNDAAMSPRIPLTSAAYALAAAGVVGFDGNAKKTLYLGAGSGQIPINNRQTMTDLNADMVDGKHFNEIVSSLPLYKCQEWVCTTKDTYTTSCVSGGNTGGWHLVLSGAVAPCGYEQVSTCLVSPGQPPACLAGTTDMGVSARGCYPGYTVNYRTCAGAATLVGYIKAP
jgi:opacity protein-like surface antigen